MSFFHNMCFVFSPLFFLLAYLHGHIVNLHRQLPLLFICIVPRESLKPLEPTGALLVFSAKNLWVVNKLSVKVYIYCTYTLNIYIFVYLHANRQVHKNAHGSCLPGVW